MPKGGRREEIEDRKQSWTKPLPGKESLAISQRPAALTSSYHGALRGPRGTFHVGRKIDKKEADRLMRAPKTVPEELTGPLPCPRASTP